MLARQPPLSQAAAADVAQLLADLAQLAEEVLPCCGPRELSNMAQGLAAGGCYSRRLMQLLLGRWDGCCCLCCSVLAGLGLDTSWLLLASSACLYTTYCVCFPSQPSLTP